MESGTTSMIVTLRSNDGEEFVVPEAVAMQAQIIRAMIQDRRAQDVVPLNVSSKILAKVIEYCKRQVIDASSNVSVREKSEWEDLFLAIDRKTLFDLVLAANSLQIKALLDLTCRSVANMLIGKTPEEIHEFFNNRER